MAIIINDYTITEFVNLEAYYRGSDENAGALDFRLEDMQDFTLSATEDKTELTGKNGRIIGYKKQNKKVTGSGTYGLISAGLMKAQTGGELTSGTQVVKKSEFKTVEGATLTTEAKAIGTEGAEIGVIRILNASGATVKSIKQGSVASATEFAYNPTTKTITLPTGDGVIADGTNIIYSYERNVDGTKVTNPSDKFSETREVWVHCFGKDACDNEYFIAIYVPRADFTGNFEIALGGDQTVQNFEFDGMTDLCNPANGNNLFEVIVYTDAE